MPRTVQLRFQVRDRGERTVKITPAWVGEGIAIHKPISFDDGEPYFEEIVGVWCLSHIPTGLALSRCMGSLDRAKSYARAWDETFAGLAQGQKLSDDLMADWCKCRKEMLTEPPRKPRQPARYRVREVA